MSEMAVYPAPPSQALSPVDYQDRAVQRLADWAHAADAAYSVATKLVQSSFVPVAFRGKPVEATAAILAGAEVGLSPMSALKAFDVIQGQAAPRAITLRAIAQSYGHEMILVESNATRCRMRGKRRGSDIWQEVTWTMDRAKDLGLTGKDGWKKQPIAMLLARATSELARLIAADAILGIGYSAEEVADGGQVDAATAEGVEPAQSGVRVMRRPRKPVDLEPISEPALEAAPLSDEPKITPAQMTAMHTLFGKLGWGSDERDEKLKFVSDVLGLEITSSKDLTVAQASLVLDALDVRVGELDAD